MAENTVDWKTLINNHTKIRGLPSVLVHEHPLKNIVTERVARKIVGPSFNGQAPSVTSISSAEPIALDLKQLDPLSEFAMEDMDPLTKMAKEDKHDSPIPKTNISKILEDDLFYSMEPWTVRRTTILTKYTTSEKLSIVTSFLSEGEKVTVKAQSTAVDKVQHRLKQLDSFEEGSQQKLDVSQAEYVSKIEQLNRELVLAWNTEQRVKALKIAIQCAKLLGDTEVLSFYPSKFVLVTDILDTFGKLVYDRLRTKAKYFKSGSITPTPLPEDFTPDMVPDSAKETCLNWFYKIASIRELVPRLYVEIALLNSYCFISTNERIESLQRMTEMVHGIGNPLVAIYVRCYLCKIGMTVLKKKSEFGFLLANFTGFLDSYQHLFSHCVVSELEKQKMQLSSYMTLYTPALDFILEAVNCVVNESYLPSLLQICKKNKNSSLILNTIISGFKPAYIANKTMELLDMMVECSDGGVPLCILLRTLGLCVTVSPPPSHQRKDILNIVWGYMPVTGSFTRTAINNASGAKTPCCGVLTGMMVLIALGFLTSTFKYIPKSTLAGVIIVAMYYLCDFEAFVLLWKSKKLDHLLLTVTLVCCLFINLEYGILIGIALNITFVLYSSARPEVEVVDVAPSYYLVKLDTGLHFTASEYVREHILQTCYAPDSTIIIDGESVGHIDVTVAKSFDVLKDELNIRKQNVIFWRFNSSVKRICAVVNEHLAEKFREDENVEQLIAS